MSPTAADTTPVLLETPEIRVDTDRLLRLWRATVQYLKLVGNLVLYRSGLKVLDFVGLAFAMHHVTVPRINLMLLILCA